MLMPRRWQERRQRRGGGGGGGGGEGVFRPLGTDRLHLAFNLYYLHYLVRYYFLFMQLGLGEVGWG